MSEPTKNRSHLKTGLSMERTYFNSPKGSVVVVSLQCNKVHPTNMLTDNCSL